MCDKCGDYNPEEDPLAMSFSAGVTAMRPEAIAAIMQVCVTELFIRAEPGEFEEIWSAFNKSVASVFDPEKCTQPEILELATLARDKLHAQRQEFQNGEFTADAAAEIDQLIGDHGVLDDDDEYFGQYL